MENRINERLERCNLPSVLELPEKTVLRVNKIETYVLKQEEEINALINKAKKNEVTRVSIAQNVGISRKTLYNDEILKAYCEDIIKSINDNFNEEKVKKLESQVNEINNRYQKLLNNIIDVNDLKIKIKEYEKEISRLINRNDELERMIYEKNEIIDKLNNKPNKSENLITFKKR